MRCVVKRYFIYRGIHEKGSGDVLAVCYSIYTIYLSLCTQTAETTAPQPFRKFPCISTGTYSYLHVIMHIHICIVYF